MLNEKINKAVDILRNGGVIIYPSESCYSFGCSAKNKKAVERIHNIKEEPQDKAVILLISEIKQIEEFGVLNETAKILSKEFHPGQLNLIIDKKNFEYLSKEGIAFRIPNNQIAIELCKNIDSAITTTSVNLHGRPSLYKIEEVKNQFENKVDYILDSGDLDENIPVSTIFDTRTNEILREGLIKEEEIETFLRRSFN